MYARFIVVCRVNRTAHAGFVLDALEQAIHDRKICRQGASSISRIEAANTSSAP
jgi:hypothetical protein